MNTHSVISSYSYKAHAQFSGQKTDDYNDLITNTLPKSYTLQDSQIKKGN